MRHVSVLKGAGYAISTVSVVLLGIVSLKAALQNPLLIACLVGGMLTSVLGMLLRWRSHRLEQFEKAPTTQSTPERAPVMTVQKGESI